MDHTASGKADRRIKFVGCKGWLRGIAAYRPWSLSSRVGTTTSRRTASSQRLKLHGLNRMAGVGRMAIESLVFHTKGCTRMGKKNPKTPKASYDVPMIRDFLDHLLWELRISHYELTTPKTDKVHQELKGQLTKYVKKR